MRCLKIGILLFFACLVLSVTGTGVQAETYIDKIDMPKLSDPQMPQVETVTLDNGMKIYLIEDHKLPLVKARIRLAAGSYLDPLDKVGLGSIVGTVMRTGGTNKMTGDEIDEKLESIGASVETGMGTTSGSASMNILSDYVDTGLEILSDVLRNPVFDQEKIDLAKTEEKTGISRRNDDAWDICFREFQKIIYGEDSPYARHTEYATVDAISRDDLMKFHDDYIAPENTMIAIWGDFKKKDMIEKLKKYFGTWKKSTVALPPIPEVNYEYKSSVSYIDKKNINQSKVRLGHIGGLITDPDYHATIVMNNILGGSFGSRLFNNVRSKQGLAYSVGGTYRSNISYPGYFFNYVFTKSETTVQAIKSIIHEIENMQVAPPTEEELRVAKDSYLNSFVFNFENKGEILDRMMTYDYYGLPRDFIFKEKEMVEKVTAEDVLAAAKKNLHPDALHIVVVGNADDFDESLGALGAVDTIDVSIPSGESSEELAVTPEMLSMGKELIMKAANALGGVDNFKKVKTTASKSTVNLVTPQGEFALNSETVTELPDKSRNVIITPMGELIMVQNGEQMWSKQGPTVVEGTSEQIEDQKKEMFRNSILVFSNLDGEAYQFVYLGQEDLGGAAVEMLQVQSPDGSMKYKLALDAASFLPVGRMYFGETMMGPGNLTEYLADYREVGGIKVPHEIKIEADGKPVATVNISEYSANVPVEEGTFTKPQ